VCVPATNTYDLTGSITFTNAPASGTLTVTSTCGGSQVFNAPFTSPQAYSLPRLTSNGAVCSVTAVVSADAARTLPTHCTAPAACTPSRRTSRLYATQDACETLANEYDITGTVTYTHA